MEGLRGGHFPGTEEANEGEQKGDQGEHRQSAEDAKEAGMQVGDGEEEKEDEALQPGECGGTEHFAENNAGAGGRGDEYTGEEALFAVIDEGHVGKHGGEHEGESDRAAIEATEVIEAGADDEPEEEGGRGKASDTGFLSPELDEFAAGECGSREDHALTDRLSLEVTLRKTSARVG